MFDLEYEFEAKLWRDPGPAAWYFITVSEDVSNHISSFCVDQKTSFGSVRVKVKIGETLWKTSLFPDKKSGCYFLPVKADVRKREKLEACASYNVQISVDV